LRNVLFVLEPLGTGKVGRSLAIAEQLQTLFPAISPHFLAAPSSAALLRAATTQFPVDDSLTPVQPPRGAPLALARAKESRRLGPRHAQQALRAAKAIGAEMVVVDGLFSAPPLLRRAKLDVVFLCDHLLDATPGRGLAALTWRAAASLLRRSVVASTSLRFFVGEPSHLASPELRVWSRRYFRYCGPISGLARLDVRDAATLRDDLGLTRKKLVVVAAGSAFDAALFEEAIAAADLVARERSDGIQRSDVIFKLFGGPELSVDDARVGPAHEFTRWLAIADAAVVPAGLSLLSECAGARVPTLALPLAGDPLAQRRADHFEQRFGVRQLAGANAASIAAELRALLERPDAHRPHDFPGPEQQKRNADYVADLIAERLGRRRPGS
jgi:UDP:flavonoid glycosyltransferase YjiC (YdhE family)